uniref:DDE-1 domain-containing protein n=1 Tax=Strongyloides venezuelensis TaxID=75913 RepID=A0A0K0FT17_STRVS
MDSIEFQDNSPYEGSINNPIILDDSDSDEEDEIVYASNESDTRLSFMRDDASTDNNILGAPETPILTNHVSSKASEDGISSPDEYHMPYLSNYDDNNSISESDLCTKTLEVDNYNRVCFFHRGYFPRRGTNTNGSIWDHPSGISFHFNELNEKQLIPYVSLLLNRPRIINLKLVLALPPCHTTIKGIKTLINLREWDRLDIEAHVSWMEFCHIFPKLNNIYFMFFKKPTQLDKTTE